MKITPTFSNGLNCTIVPTDDLGRAYAPLVLDLGDDAAITNVVATLDTTFPSYRGQFGQRLQTIRDDRKRAIRKPITDAMQAYHPFPLAVLPGPVANYVQACATAMDVDSAMIAMPMLSCLGAAIGNSAIIKAKFNYTAPASIWTAIVGESGTMKSPAIRAATRFIAERQQAMYMTYQKQLQQYDNEWRGKKGAPPHPKFEAAMVSDTTIEALADRLDSSPRGLLVSVDELDGWYGSFDRYNSGSSDRSRWLQMFDAGTVQIDRKSTDMPTILIRHAFVSITGGIQPGILAKRLTQDNLESGLAARMLFVMPPRRPKRFTSGDVDIELANRVREVFDNLYGVAVPTNHNGVPTPTELLLSPEARQMFAEFADRNGEAAFEYTGSVASAYAKFEGYALRFALGIHLSRWAAGELPADQQGAIDRESMARALVLIEWCRYEMHRVTAMLKENEDDRTARTKLEKLRAIAVNGEVTVRDWQRKNQRRFKSASDAELDLRLVVDAGLAVWVDNSTGGRPVRAIRLVDQATPAPVPMAIAA